VIARLIVAAYLVDAGVLLVVAPWTRLWDLNAFAAMYPWLGLWMASLAVRGGVAAVGVVTGAAGLREVVGVLAAQARAAEPGAPQ
jgi:hypothetical protein